MKVSSFPVESQSSHVVLAGHTGLPSDKLLTDLNKMEIEEGKQFATLIVCTPYGVNSHRLLVRGKLI